ncbi:helix-turn-helix domain-containing protein [Agromyces sp. G08B096]|uniref:Helix-turn-helix domain-containing protein n=1 Tax=Agromyces sp. G08B096 TaxID=3156399 RepID=A0AAU7W4H1_9MICO
MAKPATFDSHARVRARKLFDEGMSCNAIARELGVSASTISRWAKGEGLSFDRSATAAASAAVEVDARARRTLIRSRLYGRVEKLLSSVEAETFKTLVPSGPGEQSTRTLDYVPSNDERNISTSIANYLKEARELERADDDRGVGSAESLLGALARELGLEPADG